MGVTYTEESPEGRELWKWNHTENETNPVNGEKGMRPAQRKEFPKRLYLAGRTGQGVPTIIEGVTVEDANEERNYQSRGFREGGDNAIAHLHERDTEIAELAAARAFQDRKMTAPAKAEAEAADNSTSQHLAEIPAEPLPPKRRGRPPTIKNEVS